MTCNESYWNALQNILMHHGTWKLTSNTLQYISVSHTHDCGFTTLTWKQTLKQDNWSLNYNTMQTEFVPKNNIYKTVFMTHKNT